MFEDVEDENVDVNAESSDRAIAWAIHARGESSDLTPEEAWAVLHERYPDEPRFLLLNTYLELGETRRQSESRIKAKGDTAAGVWTPAYFLKKVDRILEHATEELHPQLRELLVFGGAVLAGAKDDDAARLAALRARIGAAPGEPNRDERDRAGLRLRRYEREVLKDIDERTRGGQALGVRATSGVPSGGSDWATATADATRPRAPYAADRSFARGDLVVHAKFGIGVVTGTEPGKVVLLFESGARKLVART